MKITLENFNYKGMHFDQYGLNLPELVDISDECVDEVITEKIKEELNEIFWKEVNTRT